MNDIHILVRKKTQKDSSSPTHVRNIGIIMKVMKSRTDIVIDPTLVSVFKFFQINKWHF